MGRKEMSTLAVIGLAALLAAGASHNPPPEALARQATPVSPVAAMALARGKDAESERRHADAAKEYRAAANAGSGEAAKRLGDLYWRGVPGVEKDLAESLRWYRVAETHGEKVAQAVRLR
jgi:TPR repeat protein